MPDRNSPEQNKTTMRHVRVPDELWEEVLEAVRWRGDPSVSHIIRRALAQYVAGTRRRQHEEQQRRRGGGDPPRQRSEP